MSFCFFKCISEKHFHTHPVVASRDVEDGLEGQPDDAGGVHGEPDELGLVEILRTLPGLEGVDGAQDDEDAVVGERHQHAGIPAVALEGDHVPPLGAHLLPDPGRLHQQPHHHHQQLAGDEAAADGHLGAGADEARPLRPVLHAAEDAGDAVGLGEQRRVAHGEGGAQAQPAQRAHGRGRLADVDEGHAVAHQHAQQQDVGQLPPAGLHHGGLVVLEEQAHNRQGAHNAQAGDGDGPDGPGVLPADVLLGEVVAAGQVGQRPLAEAAVGAGELVVEVLVGLAGDAEPAAHLPGLHALHLVLPAGVAALGGGRHQPSPGDQGGVQGEALGPVAHLPVGEPAVFLVVVEDVVAADAVADGIEADHVLRINRSEWG